MLLPWFPMNFFISENIFLKKMVLGKLNYQIYECEIKNSKENQILFADSKLYKFWLSSGLLGPEIFTPISFSGEVFHSLTTDHNWLGPLPLLGLPEDFSHALLFASAIKRSRSLVKKISLTDCVYFERQAILLPDLSQSQSENGLQDDLLLGTFLTGGVPVSSLNFQKLRKLVFGINKEELEKLNIAAGIEAPVIVDSFAPAKQKFNAEFKLAGRGKLEKFFQDNIIDIVQFPEKYKKLGINSPSAVILHGPPGCGKTFAVEMLIDFLNWPSFRIDSNAIGSKYIHETSKKIAETFSEAIEKSPSVLIIDEMDAFLTDRDKGGEHRIEEVAEFLRKIPEAIENGVLIFGMTNRLDLIDRAILRRGRFDHLVEVGMPSIEEIEALLIKLFMGKPMSKEVDLRLISQRFLGKPLSDISFFVRESARISAKNNKEIIDEESISYALADVFSRGEEKTTSKIGFLKD